MIESIGGALPPPVAGKSVNIKLSRGKVCFTPPRGKRCIPLKDPVQIPVGSTIDTRNGRVTLISASDRSGAVQDAWFYEGVFKVAQTGRSEPDHRAVAGRGQAELPEREDRDRSPEAQAEVAQAVGRRQG